MVHAPHKYLLAIIGALVGLTLAAAAVAQPSETLFGRMAELEYRTAFTGHDGRQASSALKALDVEIVRTQERADLAERAAAPIREQLHRATGQWLTTLAAVEARPLPPGATDDSRRLLRFAAVPALQPRLRDAEVVLESSRDHRGVAGLMTARGQVTIQLAQSNATKGAHQASLEKTRQQGRSNADQTRAEMKAAEEALQTSVSKMLKHKTNVDFHRYKGTLLPPVKARPSFRFGPRQKGAKTFERHTGLTYAVEAGLPVRSVAAGLVVYAGPFEGYGNLILIDHGGEYHTLYAHLSKMNVEQGDEVSRGKTIATSGETGSLEGPKLYFELRHQGRAIDPQPWFLSK